MAKKSATILLEGVLSGISASRVDRENGVIYGVRIAGLNSKNGRTYTPEAYKKATSLYEGKPCNVNHVKEGEQVAAEDRFGVWHNPRWSDTPEPGLVADLHFIKSHPLAERVCEAAERKDLSCAFGMSHNAYAGDTKPGKNGKLVIESIAEVKSVDLVADPATVNGLFESIEKKPMKDSAKKLIESACNFKFQRKLLEQFCKDQDNCKRISEEVEVPETDKPEEIAKAVFESLSFSVIKDGELTPAQKAAKVDAIATLQAKLLEGEEVEPVEPEVKTPVTESVGALKAVQLCESLKFQPTAKQIAFISESNEATAKALAEEFCRLSLVKEEKEPTAGRRVEPVQESEQVKPAQTAEELASRIA